MDLYEWTILVFQPLLAIAGCICLAKCLLPLKRGWKEENQKTIAKGIAFLILGIASFVFLILIMNKR